MRIVRNHGGFVSVKSELGAGTGFELYLPRAEPAPPVRLDKAGEIPTTKPGRGELILFIDDDRSVREMVAPTLIEQGYRVLTAANGAEALALLGQHEREVCLILADVAMPVMDGLEMMEKVHSRSCDLPVVLMSGTFDVGKAPLPAGAAGFLTKPFRLEQLLSAITVALRATGPAGDRVSSRPGAAPSVPG
jgi:CheY-like chemotaxis protein